MLTRGDAPGTDLQTSRMALRVGTGITIGGPEMGGGHDQRAIHVFARVYRSFDAPFHGTPHTLIAGDVITYSPAPIPLPFFLSTEGY
jgi:hypothetical protein